MEKSVVSLFNFILAICMDDYITYSKVFLGTNIAYHFTRLPFTESIPKPRWNFMAVDWESFPRDIECVVQFNPACSSFCERFANAIKAAADRHVEQYTPTLKIKHLLI
jgi:hypothetical protein